MGKGGRCVRLTTLPPSCAVVMKSGNLNFLEPSGPLQACNGTALPFIAMAQWLRCCATNRKVAGSIPTGVIGIFHLHKILPIAICSLGSTQPLTEMTTRSISWGQRRPVRKADNLTTTLCRCHEIWEP